MLQYCKPKDITSDGRIIRWSNPEDLKRIYEYCRQDVVVEREIGRRMMRLSAYEQKVWQLDQKINSRGIAVDVRAILSATIIVESEKERLNEEIRAASRNQIATCTAVQQIKDYLYMRGIPDVEGLAKSDVVDLLAVENLPEDCRRILELRREAGKASTIQT
jgi:DNA polymerase